MTTPLLLLLFSISAAPADSFGFISGKITDVMTGEPLIGANVVVLGSDWGAAADTEGVYLIRLPAGFRRLQASCVLYATAVDSALVASGRTARVDFALGTERYVGDSLAGTIRGIVFSVLEPPESAEDFGQLARNNKDRIKVWQTYLGGKGRCGLRRTTYSVEGERIHHYLVVEEGAVRLLTVRRTVSGPDITRECRYAGLRLVERRWNAEKRDYDAVPFNGSIPRDTELRFQLLDEQGNERNLF